MCFALGKLEEAATLFERASVLKPDDYQSKLLLTMIYRTLGRTDDMIQAAREGVQRATQELARHPEDPRPAYLGALGFSTLGELDRAHEWADRALAIDPDDILTQYNAACLYAQTGEPERACELLERLLPQANHETRAWVKNDSDFDPIRGHPRYQSVLKLIQ
jgi:adenylate cyclase